MAKGTPIYPLAVTEKPLSESRSMLLVRWNELVAWSSTIHDPRCVADLHNMRIAAKRLRYTLEIFVPILTDAEPTLRTIEEIQERIGRIHDCDVLFPLLQTAMEKERKRERKSGIEWRPGPPPFLAAEGLIALVSRKRAERNTAYEEFLLWWDALPPQTIGESLERMMKAASESSAGS